LIEVGRIVGNPAELDDKQKENIITDIQKRVEHE